MHIIVNSYNRIVQQARSHAAKFVLSRAVKAINNKDYIIVYQLFIIIISQ